LPKEARLALKLAVSVVGLVLAFHDMDLAEVAGVGRAADWPLLMGAVALSVVSVGALALRWKQIIDPLAPVRLSTVLRAHYIGLFGNNVFPLRAGEFMRADYVRRGLDKPFIAILGTIFLERSIDLAIVGALFVGLTFVLPLPGLRATHTSALLGGLLLVGLTIAVLTVYRRELAAMLARRFPGATESGRLVGELLQHRRLVALVAASGLIWVLYSLRFQAVISSIGLPIDPVLVALLLVATAAGFMLPAAPGALGTFHVAVVFSMHDIYGVLLPDAQAAAILLHLSAYVPSTLIGSVAFLTSNHESGRPSSGQAHD
jgi:glycosyltransferase 2 family protein